MQLGNPDITTPTETWIRTRQPSAQRPRNVDTGNSSRHVKTFIPPVLNSEERQKNMRRLWSKLESVFDIDKPDIPQKMEHTVGSNSLFDKYQHNKGIEKSDYRKMWKELKTEYWSWTKKASDLRDEHLRQSEHRGNGKWLVFKTSITGRILLPMRKALKTRRAIQR
ncbi:unnamed protein product [Caenorhabditis brenneri]